MKRMMLWIPAAALALVWIGGCSRDQAPEPVSAAPAVTPAGNIPVPTIDQQRQDKRGD